MLTPAGEADAPARHSAIFNVLEFGALGDGRRLNTQAIQKAIDACVRAGGGTVFFPPGQFLTGTIFLGSNVTVYLENGATLLGSTNLTDYPARTPVFQASTVGYTDKCLIYGEKLENICICGHGTIDGQGARLGHQVLGRPYLIRLSECRNIAVRGITLKDSGMWVQHYLACTQVSIEGIRVISHANANNDGIDIDGSDRVRIAGCDIDTGDDAIVLKSGGKRVTREVTVTNCALRSNANALKTGTESNGGFENIAFTNCAIRDTQLAGLALEIVDGGTLNGIVVSNLAMDGVGAPIFIRLGNRARPIAPGFDAPPTGSIANILIDNVVAEHAGKVGCAIAGLPGFPVRNVSLSNLRLSFAGGGIGRGDDPALPENAEAYPEYNMFGELPAYGFYCRHVTGLDFYNVHTASERQDSRPALMCEKVEDLNVFAADLATAGGPAIALHGVRGAMLHGCRARNAQKTFVFLGGSETRGISLLANDFRLAQMPVEASPEVPRDAVFASGNGET